MSVGLRLTAAAFWTIVSTSSLGVFADNSKSPPTVKPVEASAAKQFDPRREATPEECYQRYLLDLCRASEPQQIQTYLSSRLQERWQRLKTEDPLVIDKEFRLYKKWMVFQPRFTREALPPDKDDPQRVRILLVVTGSTVADQQGNYPYMITGNGSCRMELAKESGFWKIDCASFKGRRVVHKNPKNWIRTKCCDVK